jgi:ABC-type uncharacterized transport system involved in gliding motility auxiliary subunit
MRTLRAIIGAFFILVIAFSAISICQNIGRFWKIDVTEEKLYTLSGGTKSILSKLNQPVRAKLYYARTAALKGPDQIRYFNNYYEFVKALLEEYVAESKGMVELEIIDPRPFSDDEVAAMRYGLQQYRITEEENFFFGLVVQTQFGVEKVIPFFSPDRQRFVEYDISYLIDTAITRQKTRIGVMSSLPIMGDDMSGYMAQMMMRQGMRPKQPWTIIEHLKQKYEVSEVSTDVNDINDVDILLVVHPKELPEKTLFAIDQFVLKGGRTIICVDPFCYADTPDQSAMQMGMQLSRNSDLNPLLKTWGIRMPEYTFAGDKKLAESRALNQASRPEPIIGLLNLTDGCFSEDTVITTELNEVRVLFSGVLNGVVEDPNQPEQDKPAIDKTPLITTSNQGNTFAISGPYELISLNPSALMDRFVSGTKPVTMGYLLTGRFESSYPDGIDIEIESEDPNDPNETIKSKKHITGLARASEDCAVIVFADVDFMSDTLAYSNSFFGKVVIGDNSALLMNAIDDLSGSSDLISIRSRGNFKRPFLVVDEIERQAEEKTAQEVAMINAQIAGFQSELQSIVSQAEQGQEELINDSIVRKKKELELNILQAQRQLREIKAKRRERTDRLGFSLEVINVMAVPSVVIVFALILGLWRSVRRRYYISHASNA